MVLVTIKGQASVRILVTEVAVLREDREEISNSLFEAEELLMSLEEQRLSEQDAKLSLELAEVSAQIREFEESLKKKYKDSVDQVAALQAEMERIMLELQGLAKPNEDTEIDLEELNRRFNSEHNAEKEHKTIKGKTKMSTKVKDLFKKIAAKTHPDKTKNADLHDLFLRAKACSIDNDFEGLQAIWIAVNTSKAKRILNALNSRLRELKERVLHSARELQHLKTSDAYRMYLDYVNPVNHEIVERHYRYLMEAKASHLTMAIQNLTKMKQR